jgi:hypothetical protein
MLNKRNAVTQMLTKDLIGCDHERGETSLGDLQGLVELGPNFEHCFPSLTEFCKSGSGPSN